MTLITGGLAILEAISWGKQILLLGRGMVIYSEIVSPGYYAQLGQWPFVMMFGLLLPGEVISGMQQLRGKLIL